VSRSASDELLAGRYRLDGLLGSGGMAEVHRAWDTQLRRPVAVKLFRWDTDATGGRRFDNEIHTLARLSHPGLVCVYDAGSDEQAPFVVLQLVDGHTLRDRIADGPLAPAEVRRLGARLADALAHVHANGVIHRDVKPSNVLLDAEATPYLADFGLAQLTGATRLTNPDQLVGTAAYLAPEQVRGAELGHAVDVYALGLVLLECLTGQREYRGSDVEAAVARLHRPPVVPEDLPADLVLLLSLMTALTPRRRPTASQCAQALRGDELHLDDPVEETRSLPPARPTRKVLVAAAVVLGAVGIAWTGSGSSEPVRPGPAASAPEPATTPSSPSLPPAPAAPPAPATVSVTVTQAAVVPVRDGQQSSNNDGDNGDNDKPKSPGHGRK
jgi:serine/threonine protein kinase